MNRQKDLINHLNRTEGQIRGVIKMINNDSACPDVLTQLKAVRSNVEKVISLVAVNNLIDCIDSDCSDEELVAEAVDLLVKSR